MSKDMSDWGRLKPEERHLVSNVLAFFAASNGIANENLVSWMCHQVSIQVQKMTYSSKKPL
jgi:ribonucleoside-diphosphate reductase subunit M2